MIGHDAFSEMSKNTLGLHTIISSLLLLLELCAVVIVSDMNII